MSRGIIVIETDFPKDCYHCDYVDDSGYCRYAEIYVDHRVEADTKYACCPIEPMPVEKHPHYADEFDEGYAKGWNQCRKAFLGCSSAEDEEPGGSLLLYIPEKDEFLFMEYGDGEQLLWEDRKAGYDDYINMQTYSFDCGDFEEEDGGIFMLKDEERNIRRHINDVLMEMYGEKPAFVILKAM